MVQYLVPNHNKRENCSSVGCRKHEGILHRVLLRKMRFYTEVEQVRDGGITFLRDRKTYLVLDVETTTEQKRNQKSREASQKRK